ncbi:MAG: DsrE family protein [Halothiobacillus sp.]|jgi:intracellular sulfur oxidation DsrE/DsrF family protein|nr:DsrE family protein [Halothiobacillus sp.]
MPLFVRFFIFLAFWAAMNVTAYAEDSKPVPFVMQMTVGDSDAQRRAFLQIQKVLHDLGSNRVTVEVVAYEAGITSLLSSNKDTAHLVELLSREGVQFRACRISMRGFGLSDADFPLEVGFVPAGAPEMIRRQLQGYRYWRP